VQGFIALAAEVKKTGTESFRAFEPRLSRLLEGREKNSTCDHCGAIGDAVIALQAPREMRLDHTDSSFNCLGQVTGQAHQKLDAPITFNRKRLAGRVLED
jgi:hypothetical protein